MDAIRIRDASENDRQISSFANHILRAETAFTRSRPEDVKDGLSLVQRSMRRFQDDPDWLSELKHVYSILLQQQATLEFLAGKQEAALKTQFDSHREFTEHLEMSNLDSVGDELYALARRVKMNDVDSVTSIYNRRLPTMRTLLNSHVHAAKSLADLELARKRPSKDCDVLLAELDAEVRQKGYGQDIDHAQAIVVRRRWWALRAFGNHRCDLDALRRDMKLWSALEMHNDIRELLGLLVRVQRKIRSHQLPDMISVVRRFVNAC